MAASKTCTWALTVKGMRGDFFVFGAELLQVLAVEGEQIIIENEHADVCVVGQQVFDFINGVLDRMMPHIFQPALRQARGRGSTARRSGD